MTFAHILDTVTELPVEQQESLIDIVKMRLAERRRDEISIDAKKSIDEFRKGYYHPESSKDLIERLHNLINETE